MINDIYATSMHGHYHRTADGSVVERGSWSYRGYGNAEIELTADVQCNDAVGSRFRLRVHSAERQIDAFDVERSWTENTAERRSSIHAVRDGMFLRIEADGFGSEHLSGELELPPESIFDGPTPIWLIHLMMTALPPEDRTTTSPVITVRIDGSEFGGGFYTVSRSGADVQFTAIDSDGNATESWTVHVADDGCPERVTGNGTAVEIVRTPHVAEADPGNTQ